MAVIRLIRLCYWLKNLLVFLPVLLTHQYNLIFGDPENSLLLTFLTFSFVAAAGYIFNDLADFESDRKHPLKKKYKPIATGNIDKQVASFWLATFLVGGLILTNKYLNSNVFIWELAYFGLGVAYSLFLKRIPYLGLAIMSAGAVFRVLAGAAALEMKAAPSLLIIAVLINLVINFAVYAMEQKRLAAG